jgi:hypothetical protein
MKDILFLHQCIVVIFESIHQTPSRLSDIEIASRFVLRGMPFDAWERRLDLRTDF